LRKRLFRHESLETVNLPKSGLMKHAVIVGGGRVGKRIAEALKGFGLPLVVIELDHQRVETIQSSGIPVVFGDACHEIVLEAGAIGTARLLVVTTPDMVTTQSIISTARRQNPELSVVARTSDPSFLPVFAELGVNSVVLPEFETSLEMTRKSLLHFPIPVSEIQNRSESLRQDLFAPFLDVGRGYRTLIQLRSAEHQFDLQWVLLLAGSPISDRTIGSVEIRRRTGASVVGVIRDDKLVPNPDAGFRLAVGDLVAIIGTEEARVAFRSVCAPDSEKARGDAEPPR
jgi:CPA2 family monovalent cation:H+ antiporter-2